MFWAHWLTTIFETVCTQNCVWVWELSVVVGEKRFWRKQGLLKCAVRGKEKNSFRPQTCSPWAFGSVCSNFKILKFGLELWYSRRHIYYYTLLHKSHENTVSDLYGCDDFQIISFYSILFFSGKFKVQALLKKKKNMGWIFLNCIENEQWFNSFYRGHFFELKYINSSFF